LRYTELSRVKAALAEIMAVERRGRFIRVLTAESPPQGGPLLSQSGSAGQSARVRPGHAWKCAENSEKEEPCRGYGPEDQKAE
jgi:hypothetical protein